MRFDLKDLRTKQRIALQFYGVFFALSVGAVLYQIISANFITSDAWATVATIPVYTFSLGAIVAFVVFVLPVWTKQASKLGIGDRIVPIFMIPFTALLAIELGNLAFPTMHAQFFETQREMVFVVREFDKFGARGCSNQRELEGGLSLSDRQICGLNKDVGNQLVSGQRIVIFGKGTRWGIIPEGIRTEVE